ncbi:hypothetical protein BaRGS_00040123 [Batillaria attramentaria]|uniref:Uncharacterized protein n=1 Tax=Batillaria attramentaria TaxID=370345 RepID=A0ABD0J161_9CAEN
MHQQSHTVLRPVGFTFAVSRAPPSPRSPRTHRQHPSPHPPPPAPPHPTTITTVGRSSLVASGGNLINTASNLTEHSNVGRPSCAGTEYWRVCMCIGLAGIDRATYGSVKMY